MALQNLVFYPNKVLGVSCNPVEKFDEEIFQIITDLKDTLRYYGGLGIAAPQIGVTKRIFLLNQALLEGGNEGDFDAMIFINPRIEEEGGEDHFKEGCLSMPGVTAKVQRPVYTKIRSQGIDGEVFDYEATGYTSAAVQHELDHLNGVMYIDHISRLKKRLVLKKYKKMAKKQGLLDPRNRR